MKPKNIIQFLIEAGKLKKLKRKGWVIHGIKEPESVAEHSWRVAVMAAILADDFGVNREKAVVMALIHDLAEARVGDIPIRYNRLSKDELKKLVNEKRRKEKTAFSALASLLNGKELYDLWVEFEKGKTKEARLVKQLDKLEMHLQAVEYERSQKRDLSEFFSCADKEIKDRKLKEILRQIVKMR